MNDKIEEDVKRLIELSKEKLSGDGAKEAKEIMVDLRKKGMTSREIEELTNGRWKESTIRGYIRGVSPGSEWEGTVDLLKEFISSGFRIEDVSNFLQISKQVDIEKVGDMLSEVRAKGGKPRDLLKVYGELKQKELTISELKEAVEYKDSIESLGFSLDSLGMVKSEAEKAGSPQKVLEEISSYKELNEIKAEREQAKKEREEAKNEVNKLKKDVESLKEELSENKSELEQADKSLELYRELEENGYTLDVLKDLKGIGKSFDVFKALRKYSSLEEIESEVKGKSEEAEKIKAEIQELKKEYREELEVCKNLEERGFDLPALHSLASVLERYDKKQAFDAVCGYKSLEELNAEIDKKREEVNSLQKRYAHLSDFSELFDSLIEKGIGLSFIEQLQRLAENYSAEEIMKRAEKAKEIRELKEELKANEKELDALDEQIKEKKALISSQHEEIKKLNKVSVEAGKRIGEIEARIEQSENTAKLLEFIDQPRNFDKEFVAIRVAPVVDALKTWVEERREVSFPSLAVNNAENLAQAIRE